MTFLDFLEKSSAGVVIIDDQYKKSPIPENQVSTDKLIYQFYQALVENILTL